MKKLLPLLLLLVVICLQASAAEELPAEFSPADLVPAATDGFVQTTELSRLCKAYSAFAAMHDSDTKLIRAASNIARVTGVDFTNEKSLSKAGISIKQKAGFGFDAKGGRAANLFIMLPVADGEKFATSFAKALRKLVKNKSRDMYPAISLYRGVKIGQIGKDIFYFAMKGYFFICSSGDAAASLIDCDINNGAKLANDAAYADCDAKRNKRFTTLSLFARREAIRLVPFFEDANKRFIANVNFICADVLIEGNRLRFKAGADFKTGSEDAAKLLSVIKTGGKRKVLYNDEFDAYAFFSINPLSARQLRDLPAAAELYKTAEQKLKKLYGITLADVIIAAADTINMIKPDAEADEYAVLLSAKDKAKAAALADKISAFMKRKKNSGAQTVAGEQAAVYEDEEAKLRFALRSKNGVYTGTSPEAITLLLTESLEKHQTDADVWGLVYANNAALAGYLQKKSKADKETSSIAALAPRVDTLKVTCLKNTSFVYVEADAAFAQRAPERPAVKTDSP